ncbi:MAG: M20/M25/M40 family metallo-hydrolase [Pontiellaceae bacterium]|nr:M20/M25/M40 family metallo-hydrolase [Pontiellaceae bacterium]MBN2784846.1 M20/M25/M40 family metallo-hydrolase [Pontiellaceae bacterium]
MALSPEELVLLKEVVSLPTAPFHEQRVQAFIRKWAVAEEFRITADCHGNLLLCFAGKGRQKGAPWVLQAHMDHPGFSWIKRRGRFASAWFRGGVLREFFPDACVRFFPEGQPSVRGTVRSVQKHKESGFFRCRIELDQSVDLPEGTLGMWDLPEWRRRGNMLSLRVADDLCGVASVLLALRRHKSSGCNRRVYGLLTRAEEVGFVGALAAAQNGLIDPRWPVLGIEASREQSHVPLGGGAVVRVGDAMTLFDPALTAILRKTARDLSSGRKTHSLRYIASLMPGGSTESTGLALMGFRTCAVCLPLGNYHNMGSGSRIAPEKIHLQDLAALIALLESVVQSNPDVSPNSALKDRLLENYRKRSPLL